MKTVVRSLGRCRGENEDQAKGTRKYWISEFKELGINCWPSVLEMRGTLTLPKRTKGHIRYARARTHTHTHTHACTHRHAHTCMHRHTHTHTHMHAQTHTHTHPHAQSHH